MAGRPIDEKIVVMKLDNENFKKKATETTSIFGKLKSVLNNVSTGGLAKATADMTSLNRAASSFDGSHMSRSVDAIASRFSTLGVVGTTALMNLTNKAVDAGLRIQKSLTTDQIFSGFNEYELKMRSIGTMLSNTEWAGSTLEDVKNTLNELNAYADNTIYSFGEMTTSIGRFTAAGVTLEDSAIAIKGLGNLAAASGAEVHQLNTAMYQVSQGLAAGRFGLEDWNSMVNAGMGGKKTQDALMATAKAMGQNIDMSDGFRLSLQQGWLTADVFLETLKQFGEDESMTEAATSVRTFTGMMDALKESIGSGWATSWELIFGDFEEATRLWTGLSKIIGGVFQSSTDARNDFLRSLIDSGALQIFGATVKLTFTPIMLIFKSAKAAFEAIFGSIDGASFVGLISGFKDLVSSIQLSDTSIRNIQIIFTGLFSVIAIGYEVLKMFGQAIVNLIPGVGSIGAGLLTLIAYIFKIPTAIYEAVKSGNELESTGGGLSKVFESLSIVLSGVVTVLTYLGSVASQTFGILFSGNYTAGPWSEGSAIVNFLTSVNEGFKSFIKTIGNVDLAGIGSGIVNFFVSIKDGVISLKDAFMGIGDWFSSIFDIIADNQGWILAGGGITGLAAILWKLWEVVDAVTKPLLGFGEVLEEGGNALQAFAIGIHVKSLLTIAIAVGILALSFKSLADLDAKQISTGLYMIIGSLAAMVGALFLISKYDITGSFGATLAIIGLASAVYIMGEAIEKISEMNYAELTKGIVGLVAILGTLSGAIVLMNKYGGPQLAASAAQFVAIAVSVHILLSAIKTIGEIDVGTLAKGVATIGVLLLELALFIKIAAGPAFGPAAAVGLLGIAVSVKMIASSIEDMGKMNVDVLKQGLITIAGVLTAIAIFSRTVANAGLLASGAGIALLGVSLNLMVAPISALGNMQLEVLAKGIGAIAITLGAIALASQFMTGLIPAAIGIGLLAVSLTALIAPIAAFGAMEWDTMLKGMTAAILVIGLIAATSSLLAPAVVPMLAFAGALAILGLGVAAAGVGMAAFAKGLILLATLSSGAVVAIVATLTALVTGVSTLIPAMADLFLKLITATIEAIDRNIPKLHDAMTKMLETLMSKIGENLPKLMKSGTDMIIALVEGWEKEAPRAMQAIADMMTTVIIAYLKAVEGSLSKIIAAGADLIIKFLDGVETEVPRVIERMAEFVVNMINAMTNTLRTNGPEFSNAVLGLMAEVLIIVANAGSDIIRALFGWIPGVNEAMGSVAENAERMIRENFGAEDAGNAKGEEFATGLIKSEGTVLNAGQSLASSGKEGAESVKMDASGVDFGNGFANGIISTLTAVGTAALSLAKKAYNTVKEELDINSPSVEMDELGKDTGAGYAGGIEKSSNSIIGAIMGWTTPVKQSTAKVSKEIEKEAVKSSANTGTKAVESGYKSAGKANTKGAKTAKKTAKKTAEDIAREARDVFKEKMEDLDYQFEMGEIDTTKYVKEIEKLRNSYSKYKDLVRDANLKIKDLEDKQAKDRQDRLKKEEDDAKAAYDRIWNSRKSLIDERKQYNKLSLSQELEAWERMQSKYEQGTNERKEAEREVYRLKNELNSKMLQLNTDYVDKVRELTKKLVDDENALKQAYSDSVRSRQSDLSGFTSIFDKVKDASETSSSELLKNLKGQYETLEEWAEDIEQLSKKGIDKGLLEELRKMGPSAYSEIHKLTRMTQKELEEYSEVWVNKNKLARELAIDELAYMKTDTTNKINDLRSEAAKQLDIYKNEWITKMQEIRFGTENQFVGLDTTMGDIGKNAIQALIDGMKSMEGPLAGHTKKLSDSISNSINKTLKLPTVTTKVENVSSSARKLNNGLEAKKTKVNTVLDYDKVNNNISNPNTEYSLNTISSVQSKNLKKTSESLNLVELGKTISKSIDKLQNDNNKTSMITVPVYLDSGLLTEVISENQEKQTSINSIVKGVV